MKKHLLILGTALLLSSCTKSDPMLKVYNADTLDTDLNAIDEGHKLDDEHFAMLGRYIRMGGTAKAGKTYQQIEKQMEVDEKQAVEMANSFKELTK